MNRKCRGGRGGALYKLIYCWKIVARVTCFQHYITIWFPTTRAKITCKLYVYVCSIKSFTWLQNDFGLLDFLIANWTSFHSWAPLWIDFLPRLLLGCVRCKFVICLVLGLCIAFFSIKQISKTSGVWFICCCCTKLIYIYIYIIYYMYIFGVCVRCKFVICLVLGLCIAFFSIKQISKTSGVWFICCCCTKLIYNICIYIYMLMSVTKSKLRS